MGKNNRLINSVKLLAKMNQVDNLNKAADRITPQIYAAMAIALHRTYGFGYERINRAFLESQKIWQAYDGDVDGMVKQCEEETGVTVEFREGSMDQW